MVSGIGSLIKSVMGASESGVPRSNGRGIEGSGLGDANVLTPIGDSENSDCDDGLTWIDWFCSLRGNDFMSRVDFEFVKDPFNLYGLSELVCSYESALETIRGSAPSEEEFQDQYYKKIHEECVVLYGLVHARYILTTKGLQSVREKYVNRVYGSCPRVACHGTACLPTGVSDKPNVGTLRVFCPQCRQTYVPRGRQNARMDGAFFGPYLPAMFLMSYQVPQFHNFSKVQPYEAKVFGFRLHDDGSQRYVSTVEKALSNVRAMRRQVLPAQDFDPADSDSMLTD